MFSSLPVGHLPHASPPPTLENSPVLHAEVDFIGSLQELGDINLPGKVTGKPTLGPQLPQSPGLISGLSSLTPTPIVSEGYTWLVSASPSGSLPLVGGKGAEKVVSLTS